MLSSNINLKTKEINTRKLRMINIENNIFVILECFCYEGGLNNDEIYQLKTDKRR